MTMMLVMTPKLLGGGHVGDADDNGVDEDVDKFGVDPVVASVLVLAMVMLMMLAMGMFMMLLVMLLAILVVIIVVMLMMKLEMITLIILAVWL